MWRVHLRCHSGKRIILSPMHYLSFRKWEDRSLRYRNFIDALVNQLRQNNPKLVVIYEHHWTLRLNRQINRIAGSVVGFVLLWVFKCVRGVNSAWIPIIAGRMMRVIGPWLRGQRVARANLIAAFPNKSTRKIDSILRGMWDNIGRMTAEYARLENIWNFQAADPATSRIVIESDTMARVAKLQSHGGPVLCFGAHLANWEIPALAAKAFGIKSAMIYRQPDSTPVAKEILRLRETVMGSLIPTGPGAAWKIRNALRRGCMIGMLVDQHSVGGVDAIFFGRPCKVNATLGRLARQFDCPIQGARAIRLPDGRFRLELTDPLALPRDDDGRINVAATMQKITFVIEEWVREHPKQWLWFHRRWR
jgi:KDO2-lipid IV(A) lauroyltransferase